MPRLHTRAEDLSFAADMIDRGWVRVVEDAGRVVGFSACDGSTVQALYVDMDQRARGYGGMLLADLQATRPALLLWTFQANTPALAFYARHGFVEIERGDGAGNDEGLPDIRLKWERDRS